MAGQVQLKKYDQESLYNYYKDKFICQGDKYFMTKKFAIKTDYNELQALHSYILQDILCDDNCEIVNFLKKKLRGALGDENIEIVDLKTLQTKYRDITNNYYHTEQFAWESPVEW